MIQNSPHVKDIETEVHVIVLCPKSETLPKTAQDFAQACSKVRAPFSHQTTTLKLPISSELWVLTF